MMLPTVIFLLDLITPQTSAKIGKFKILKMELSGLVQRMMEP